MSSKAELARPDDDDDDDNDNDDDGEYYMAARGYEFYVRVRDTFTTRRKNSFPQAAM